jgi:tetratricopeptide (TPR) repeat protein
VVRAAPAGRVDESAAKAHYSLAVVMLSRNQTADGIAHLRSAIEYQPSYFEARAALAEALRRNGAVRDSLDQYEQALRLNPRAPQLRWGRVLSLVRLQRYADAERELTSAVAAHPDHPEFQHLLIRVLSAAPDPAVRDGARAMTLAQELLRGQKTTEVGETVAMAYAEVGAFDQAAAIQRGVLDALRRGGQAAAARRIETNLRAYERGRPLRSVWVGEE